MSAVDVQIPTATPKEQGTHLQESVIETINELEAVDDEEAEWHDACLTAPLPAAAPEALLLDCLVVQDGTPIEIKGAQRWISNGAGRRRGRWYVKRAAHEKLLERDGAYVLAVYEPGSEGGILELAVIPAAIVDQILTGRWSSAGSARSEGDVAKVSWSRLLAIDRVERRGSA